MLLKDLFWLWGHPEGRYNTEWGNRQVSRMTPMEFCLNMGIPNTFMVPAGWDVNHRQYNKSFATLNKVGWDLSRELHKPGRWEEFLEEIREFPNIQCVVYDDYKLETKKRPVSIADLKAMQDRFHNNSVRPLQSWMVLYTNEFGVDPAVDAAFQPFMAEFDGIIMWNWAESHYRELPEKFEIFKKMTPNNHRMFGCYLWNFGECKPATAEAVIWQLDFYRERILAGEAEGIVFHTNTMADLDLESYDAAYQWVQQHGNDIVER